MKKIFKVATSAMLVTGAISISGLVFADPPISAANP